MSTLSSRLLPSVTNMIRLDHTHVLSTFHQYKSAAPSRVKKGLANTIFTALEIHAQLEEEIFYPAMSEIEGGDAILGESESEHAEMRRLIHLLRHMEPEAIDYDATLMSLMRNVLHHVADEETVVLPEAERLLPDRLGELGLRMTKRRMELVAPRSGEIALNMARSASGNKVAITLVAAAAAAGCVLMGTRHRTRAAAGRLLRR
jgi:iron-sulfur cluster repair protein YtfE (RIC family)